MRQVRRAPVLGAVHVAGAQLAALEITELVEDEERVVTGIAEVAVPGRALLLALSGSACRAGGVAVAGRHELDPVPRLPVPEGHHPARQLALSMDGPRSARTLTL